MCVANTSDSTLIKTERIDSNELWIIFVFSRRLASTAEKYTSIDAKAAPQSRSSSSARLERTPPPMLARALTASSPECLPNPFDCVRFSERCGRERDKSAFGASVSIDIDAIRLISFSMLREMCFIWINSDFKCPTNCKIINARRMITNQRKMILEKLVQPDSLQRTYRLAAMRVVKDVERLPRVAGEPGLDVQFGLINGAVQKRHLRNNEPESMRNYDSLCNLRAPRAD